VSKSPTDRLPALVQSPRTWALAAVVSAGLAEAAAGGAAAVATRDLFAAISSNQSDASTALYVLGTAGVVGALSRGSVRISSEWVGRHYAGNVRKALYAGLANSRWSDLARRRRSSILIRFVGDLGAFRDWAGRGLADVIVSLTVVPVSATVLLMLDARLALAGLLPLTIGTALGVIASLKIPHQHASFRTRRGASAGILGERALMAPVLDQLGRTKKELRRLEEEAVTLRQAGVRRALVRSFARGLPEAGAAIGGAAILATSVSNGISTGTAAGALAALGLTVTPLAALGRAWDRFANWRIAYQRIDRLLADGPRLPKRSQSKRVLHPDQILSGLHRLGIQAVRDGRRFSAVIPRDQSIRSHLRCLAGLERADDALRNRRGLMPRVGLVSEDAPFMRGSVRRNITLGASKRPSDEDLAKLVEEFGATVANQELSGLDSTIDEDGRMLELDVKARLLLVRAVVMKAQVVLIDERLLHLLTDRDHLLAQVEQRLAAPLVILSPEQV